MVVFRFCNSVGRLGVLVFHLMMAEGLTDETLCSYFQRRKIFLKSLLICAVISIICDPISIMRSVALLQPQEGGSLISDESAFL